MTGRAALRNQAAVIGVGTTGYGRFPDTDEYGLVVCRIPSCARMGEVLGLDPRWSLTLPAHGRMSAIGPIEAATATATGQASTVALLYANIGHSRRVNYGGEENPGVWNPWDFTSPGTADAMMFRRHTADAWNSMTPPLAIWRRFR